MEILALGFAIFVFSYVPLIILENHHIALRNSFVPLIGLAMATDSLLGLFKGKYIFTCLLAIGFIIIAPSELKDYRDNYYMDRRIVEYVASQTSLEKNNVIEDAKVRYVNSNFDFGEHITSVSSSDWALTGAVREFSSELKGIKYYFLSDNLVNLNLISLKGF